MKSILFIEADRTGANPPRAILGRAGYLVFAVQSAREAIVFAARSAPDLVVAGASAEGPGGEALLRALRSEPALREIPVLAVVTADDGALFADADAPGEAETPGISPNAMDQEGPLPDGQPDEIVRTPANPFELISKVRYLLNEDIRRPPPRLTLKRTAEVQSGAIQASGFLLNLSGSGALIETQVAGALKGPVRIRFRLPQTERVIEPVGRVIRRIEKKGEPGRIAVEFVEMDPESQRALASFLFLNG